MKILIVITINIWANEWTSIHNTVKFLILFYSYLFFSLCSSHSASVRWFTVNLNLNWNFITINCFSLYMQTWFKGYNWIKYKLRIKKFWKNFSKNLKLCGKATVIWFSSKQSFQELSASPCFIATACDGSAKVVFSLCPVIYLCSCLSVNTYIGNIC